MKKKMLIAALLAILTVLTAFGCGTKPVAPNNTVAPSETENAADHYGKPFDEGFDMALVIGGKTYPIRIDSAEVIAALGEDYEYSEAISCVYEGYDKTFTYDGLVLSTVPVDGEDVIEMYSVYSADYKTPRNITIGATREEVVAAYGEAFFDDGYYVTYTKSGDPSNIAEMRIQFFFENDVLKEFFIYSPSYSN